MRRAASRALRLALAVVTLASAASRARAEEGIVLADGELVPGRLEKDGKVRDAAVRRIETDFGWARAAAREVRRSVKPKGTGGPFSIRRVRVARCDGVVERRSGESSGWSEVAFREGLEAGDVNRANRYVRPGEALRTGTDGSVHLQVHRQARFALAPGSEIVIPTLDAEGDAIGDASVHVVVGTVVHRVEGRPRGGTYVVSSPVGILRTDGAWFAVVLDANGGRRAVVVKDGAVSLGKGGTVRAGQTASFDDEGAVHVGFAKADAAAAIAWDVLGFPSEEMVHVPGGVYALGDPRSLPHNRNPVRKFELTGFWIDVHETSNADFADFAAATGRPLPSYFVDDRPPPGLERAPVHSVTWATAAAFAAWRGRRLPTEVQWEAAARGPDSWTYSWGERNLTPQETLDLVDYLMLLPGAMRSGPTHLGRHVDASTHRFGAVDGPTPDVSPFGCLNMSASVGEWCQDYYQQEFYALAPSRDPTGPQDGTLRVIRGALNLAAVRFGANPDWGAGVGIRCARTKGDG